MSRRWRGQERAARGRVEFLPPNRTDQKILPFALSNLRRLRPFPEGFIWAHLKEHEIANLLVKEAWQISHSSCDSGIEENATPPEDHPLVLRPSQTLARIVTSLHKIY
jgi:hypothetical protein